MSNVLVIGDTHAPCLLDGYVDFLLRCYEFWECNRVVHIGDLVDNCALSFHLKKPHQKDPVAEYEKALEQVKQITEAFPKADLMLGNHDVLPYRWCNEVGIPESMMRDFSAIWQLPKKWRVWPRFSQLVIDKVIYQHGDRGKGSAILNAKAEFASCVQGHHHQKSEIIFSANLKTRIFGCQTGCGVDWKHHAQEYGKKYSAKPIISAAIILNGTSPVLEPMPL